MGSSLSSSLLSPSLIDSRLVSRIGEDSVENVCLPPLVVGRDRPSEPTGEVTPGRAFGAYAEGEVENPLCIPSAS